AAGGGEDTKSIIGKNPGTSRLTVKQDGGEVDAITAATISSRAFLHAVEVAYKTFTEKADAASSATKQEEGGAQ
ncbi:MAG: FMN-binding protein, partial [Bacteroidales bacterium]|nr:FMN-binding protein [Bacteroidales bacterium]